MAVTHVDEVLAVGRHRNGVLRITIACTGVAAAHFSLCLHVKSRHLGDAYRYPTEMNQPFAPPDEIDGARVLRWAWSGNEPFGQVPGADSPDIFGLAIATYNDAQFYRFSCDRNWDCIQDGLYDSIDEAISQLPDQYRHVDAVWVSMSH
ncbi:hypothetical protein [Rubripirellula obstinata]|uniref:hypothetical protein n=1 Tax=Rubripirellula obstinata TaxID=406547 RepID=UPI00192E5847|nr:hypothetical protein [Rubripirellula obstinata]